VVAYLKDAVTRWLSRSWAWYRQRKSVTLARREQELEFLTAEPALLTLHFLHHMSYLLLCFLLFGLFLFIPAWADFMHSSPFFSSWVHYSPLSETDPNALMSDMKLVTFPIAVFSFLTGFIGMSGVSVGLHAYRRLYARKKADFERNPDPKPTN
jgi:hypothetical protein